MQAEDSKKDYMLDIETAGRDASGNRITSLALVEFDSANFEPTGNTFICAIQTSAGRYANTETMQWRKDNDVDAFEARIKLQFNIALNALLAINKFLYHGVPVIWAKPTTFDVAFLTSYYNQYTVAKETPWHYRDVVDCRSWALGRGWDLSDAETHIREMLDGQLPAHEAVSDCLFQIKCLQLIGAANK